MAMLDAMQEDRDRRKAEEAARRAKQVFCEDARRRISKAQKQQNNNIKSAIILVLAPIVTYVVTMVAYQQRGYAAIGGEVLVPFGMIALALYISCRRVE